VFLESGNFNSSPIFLVFVIHGVTVNLAALVPVPPAVVTDIVPVTAPVGTRASTTASLTTFKLVAATPPNVTDVALVKPCPLMATEVPTGPLVGVNDAIDGTTVKFVVLFAVPPAVVTPIFCPVRAPAGTVATIWVSEFIVKVAAFPPIVRPEACLRLTPVIVTVVPTTPLVGVKLVICGVTRNARLLDMELVKVFSTSVPVVAPAGTTAVM